ncbi:hypothetical protein DFJ73DRAFT_963839 [Zopfochytrium polystomum]|nr:hypothetical protein DFJ73DRAFT_963839 [Zopfochytrium polystomum]
MLSTTTTTTDFATVTDAALSKAKEHYSATDFKPSGKSKGAALYVKHVADTAMPVTKGEITFVGFAPEQVLAKLLDLDTRKEWDKGFEGAEFLERFDEESGIVHSKQEGALFVSGRDFSIAYRVYREDGFIISLQTSIEDERASPIPGRVRGHLTVAAWFLKKVDNGTEVVYITHVNPSGTVPGAVLRLVAGETPAITGCLYDVMRKKNDREKEQRPLKTNP